jgi:tetratricopeptide (TPR) repeat protein
VWIFDSWLSALAIGETMVKGFAIVSILLEVFGKGLEEDLSDLFRPFYSAASDSETANMSRALACWEAGHVSDAKDVLGALCARNPRHIPALAALAALHEQEGEHSAVLRNVQALEPLLPDQACVPFALGLCYEKLRQPVPAATCYRRALKRNPSFLPARYRLAATALRMGRPDEAAEQYEDLSQRMPEQFALRTLHAGLLFYAGRYKNAAHRFEETIAMEPENWAVEDGDVARLMIEGRLSEALGKTRALLEQQGPFPDLYVQLGNLYSLSGDDAAAVKHYLEAIDMQPTYIEAMIKLATHHLQFGRWEEAAETFGRAAECTQRLMLNYIGMGVAHAAAGHIRRAGDSLDLAGALEPNTTLLYTQMIQLHWRITRADEFLHRIEATLPEQRHPGEPELEFFGDDELTCHAGRLARQRRRPEGRFCYGILLQASGQTAEATRQYALTVKVHPTHTPAMIKLGLLLKEQGREKFAARVFHRIFWPSREQMDLHYRLAMEYTQPGRLDETVEDMLAAAHGEKTEEDVRTDLNQCLVTLGLRDRNVSLWRSLTQTHRVRG